MYHIIYCLLLSIFVGEGAVILLQLFEVVWHMVAQLVDALRYE
jgi:hypothetical protein